MKSLPLFLFFLLGALQPGNGLAQNSADSTAIPNHKTEQMLFGPVEEQPIFPGCDVGRTNNEKAQCSNKKVMAIVESYLQENTQGLNPSVPQRVIGQFSITAQGKMEGILVLRGVGEPYDQIALNAMENLKTFGRWTPGKQRGKPVRVTYSVPMSFRGQH